MKLLNHSFYHLFFGIIFIGILHFIFPQISFISLLIIFSSSILIDFDHYLDYVYRKKNFSLKKACEWFVKRKEKLKEFSKQEKQKYKRDILIFHGIEFLILLIILSFIYKIFLWIFLGILFHIILDIVYTKYYHESYLKMSQIYNIITNKGKKDLR